MGRVLCEKQESPTPQEFHFSVKLCDDVVLTKSCEHIVRCIVDSSMYEDCEAVFVPNQDKVASRGIIAACCVVNSWDSVIPVRVINVSDVDIKLYKNTTLGHIEQVGNITHINDSEYLRNVNTENVNSVDHIKTLTNAVLENTYLNEDEKKRVVQLIIEYADIFSKSKFDIGCSGLVKHEIHVENVPPIHQPVRRVPFGLEQKVDDVVDDLLDKGIIEPSKSAWCSPIVVVMKKNGDIRLCVDYRRLNAVTIKPCYPIPDTQYLLDSIGEASYFSGLDLSNAYYQCKMQEEHMKYTAFATRRGQFEFSRMPFGLTGAPFTFQRLMHLVLQAENWETCLIYLDDILVFAPDFKEHLRRLQTIFEKIRVAGVKLSPEKCSLFRHELKFLGHVVSKSGVKTDDNKISVVRDWPKPVTITEMRSFLGFVNYYRRFVKNFALIAAPLESLMKSSCKGNINTEKKALLQWNDEADNSYRTLKACLTSAPILAFPDKNCEFILDTDACHNGIGAVLSQSVQGEERVIAYGSRKLTKCEQSYCVTRKELLGVYFFVQRYRNYLMGRHFTIRTDHKALQWLMNWRNPNTSQYCNWIGELSNFDFTIEHRAGEKHANADFLSRRFQCEQCEIEHESPQTKRNVKHLALSVEEIHEPIRAISEAENKKQILEQFHDAVGHVGYEKTLELIKQHHQWKGMATDVKNYIAGCLPCAERKAHGHVNKVNNLHVTADYPFQKVMIDITDTSVPSRAGHRYILGVIDVFSRYLMLIPLRTTNSSVIANALLTRWISVFGAPEEIISDGGTNLNSQLMGSFYEFFRVKKTTSSPYHPQTNGIIERSFRTVKDMIYATCCECGIDWLDALPHVEMGLRVTVHKSLGYTPYQIIFGRKMMLPAFQEREKLQYRNASDFIVAMGRNRDLVKRKLCKTEGEVIMPSYAEGDLVMVKAVLPTGRGIFKQRYFGPCRVVSVLGPKTYCLQFNGKKLVRNVSYLKHCQGFRDTGERQACKVESIRYPTRQRRPTDFFR